MIPFALVSTPAPKVGRFVVLSSASPGAVRVTENNGQSWLTTNLPTTTYSRARLIPEDNKIVVIPAANSSVGKINMYESSGGVQYAAVEITSPQVFRGWDIMKWGGVYLYGLMISDLVTFSTDIIGASETFGGSSSTKLSATSSGSRIQIVADATRAMAKLGAATYRGTAVNTWTAIPSPLNTGVESIAYAEGKGFVAVKNVANNNMYTSPDTVTWTVRSTGGAKAKVVAVGGELFTFYSSNQTGAYYSSNGGVTNTPIYLPTSTLWRGAAKSDTGLYMVAGNNAIATSPDLLQ